MSIIMDDQKLEACVVQHALTRERSIEERIDKWMELARDNTHVPESVIPSRDELLNRVGTISTEVRRYNGNPTRYIMLQPQHVVMYLMHAKFAYMRELTMTEASSVHYQPYLPSSANNSTSAYQLNSVTSRWNLNYITFDKDVEDVSYGHAGTLKTWAKDCASGDMETFMRSRRIVAMFLVKTGALIESAGNSSLIDELKAMSVGGSLPPFVAEVEYPYKYDLQEFTETELVKEWTLCYEEESAAGTHGSRHREATFREYYPQFYGANPAGL